MSGRRRSSRIQKSTRRSPESEASHSIDHDEDEEWAITSPNHSHSHSDASSPRHQRPRRRSQNRAISYSLTSPEESPSPPPRRSLRHRRRPVVSSSDKASLEDCNTNIHKTTKPPSRTWEERKVPSKRIFRYPLLSPNWDQAYQMRLPKRARLSSSVPPSSSSSNERSSSILLPILIPPIRIGTHDKEGGRVDIPEAVSHLPLNAKVDVMDRATGRVLTGDQAVSVVDLAKELRDHASYEPLVVGPQGERVREARSSQNTIVRTGIQPQETRNLWNEFDGNMVLVTSGPKKGLIGTANACTLAQNHWYFVSPLFGLRKNVDVVVHARHLTLISDEQKGTDEKEMISSSESNQHGLRQSSNSTTGNMKPLNNLQTRTTGRDDNKEIGIQVADIMNQMLAGASIDDV